MRPSIRKGLLVKDLLRNIEVIQELYDPENIKRTLNLKMIELRKSVQNLKGYYFSLIAD